MKKSDWKDTAELIGIAAIVASLIFVGVQMRQDRIVAQADAWLQYVDTQVALAQVIAENAEVWNKGLAGEELSGAEQKVFNQIAFTVDQKHASRFVRSNLGIRSGPAEMVAIAYAEELYMYPGLRAYFNSRVEMRGRRGAGGRRDSMLRAVSEHLAKLDSGQIEVPSTDGHSF